MANNNVRNLRRAIEPVAIHHLKFHQFRVYADRFLKREHYVIASACFKGLTVIYENRACARSRRTWSVLCFGMIPGGRSSPSASIEAAEEDATWFWRAIQVVEMPFYRVEDCCLTNPRSLFRYFFREHLRFIHQVVAGNKERSVLLFRDSLVKLFPLKNHALFKKAETPADETLDLVDLVLVLFRAIKGKGLRERLYIGAPS